MTTWEEARKGESPLEVCEVLQAGDRRGDGTKESRGDTRELSSIKPAPWSGLRPGKDQE